jgi:hypothetical protein
MTLEANENEKGMVVIILRLPRSSSSYCSERKAMVESKAII